MTNTAVKAGNGARPPGASKTHNTRANAKASSQPSPQSQPTQANPPATSPPSTADPQQANPSSGESQNEKLYVIRKEILSAVANRLDEILEKCTTIGHFKKAITSLHRYTQKAADNDQGTVIQLTIEDLKTIQEEIQEDLSKWYENVDNKLDSLRSKQNKILEAAASFNKSATKLQLVAKELENQVGKVTVTSDKITTNATPYRDALTGGVGNETRESVDVRVRIDVERKAKQIMVIIKDSETAMLHPDALMEKANGIIAKIKDSDRPEAVKIEFITKFPNGGALLHLNSKEAAKWLRDPTIEEAFLKKLDKNAYVKERPHNVLLRGVPIIFDPGNETHLREIEETNGMLKYSILKAKWIKPEERRRNGQTHAHATATISTVETANTIIKEGLEICGVRIRPEKLRQEPLQCLRCRRWGHFAANCIESEDACGTCGEAHRTALCKNTTKKHCVSCNTDTHTS